MGDRQAVLNVYTNPLPGVKPTQLVVQPGVLIRDLVPSHGLPWVCVVNGLPLRRDYWLSRAVFPGDVIELHLVYQGNGSRSILALVATIALSVFAPAIAGGILGQAANALTLGGRLLAAGIAAIGSAIINALIAPKPIEGSQTQEQSSTYNVALSGNQARLGQPIPVIYGRMRTFPDFAAQPYMLFDHSQSMAGDQYYYALLAIGHGNFDIEKVEIGDTDINHFQDVEYNILPPGTPATLALPTVVSSPEVAGQDMLTGQYVGAFSACGPRRRCTMIAVDVVCPRGLGTADNNGFIQLRSITFNVEVREIDDFGNSDSPWFVVGTNTVTANTSQPVRRTFLHTLSGPFRVEVRVVRTDERSDNVRHLNDIQWVGLSALLNDPAPLAPTVTHLEIRMRASEQLSGLSQRKIAVTATRRVRTWDPHDGWSAEEVPSRSIAWALADKWKNPVYGDGLPDSRIDLLSLWELDQIWQARQDHLDVVFDTKTDSASADQAMAACGRASCFWKNGVRTIVRDQINDLPVAAYTARNMLPGTASMDYLQVTEETADGVIVEYFDNRAWDWLDVECPAPGVTVETMTNPVRLRMPGITGAIQAEREGLYQAAQNVYRRRFATWQTEMDAVLASFGAPVMFAPVLHASSQSGDVAFWEAAEPLVLGLSEPVRWADGAHAIRLVRPDGSVTDPIQIAPGGSQWDVVLAESLDFDPIVDDASRERTKFVLGPLSEVRRVAKVLAIRPQGRGEGGAPIYQMTALIEDNRVHEVDLHLLPSPDEVQDPVEPPPVEEPPPPNEPGIVVLNTMQLYGVNWSFPGTDTARYELLPDGRLQVYASRGSPAERIIPGQWLLGAPVEPSTAALYEARARNMTISPTTQTWKQGDFDIWLPMTEARTWELEITGEHESIVGTFVLEVREISTGIVQGTATIRMEVLVGGSGA